MKSEEIYELARKRQPLPDTATLSELALYTTARNIYKAFSSGILSEEQAKREKAQSIAMFERFARGEYMATIHAKRMAAISETLLEAEKNGCEYCKKVARIFDGREIV